MTYVATDPELDYVQGMNDFLSPIIYVAMNSIGLDAANEYLIFWMFQRLMSLVVLAYIHTYVYTHTQTQSLCFRGKTLSIVQRALRDNLRCFERWSGRSIRCTMITFPCTMTVCNCTLAIDGFCCGLSGKSPTNTSFLSGTPYCRPTSPSSMSCALLWQC